ncbi:hypothetical protein CLV62_12911 [Dysgonomonas alginatilytica]|uniref:Uncharacterized protein n=1 Tax=Dysgonomonas alginatilytica TaxID=1605892 RepID=A0A2V3PL59_9BACT|nr:hypothetical protein [Dysgonomonas alginatilytica]PXV60235.1 hypothetical protein CLV62_12911 [Dysgonomonas alginatilytica]
MLVIIILAPNISFGGYDGYEKTFSFEGYTVYSYIEFSDNTKETVAVTIYEELPILCFLEYKMYETKEINKYLEKAEYDMDAKTMYLTMLSGNTISTEIVHLRK